MSKDLRSDIAEPVIEVHPLRCRYGGQRSLLARSGPGIHDRASRAQQGFEAVRGVDLQVGRGELFALLGTNGAGKTSAVELIEGLAKHSGGSVRILGHDPWADRAVVWPQIGIMLQEAGLPGALTVGEMARAWHGTLDHPRTVGETLEMVVLQHRADVPNESLSGDVVVGSTWRWR
jgi:ABC-2 type transport system ATP-binding protein